MIISERIIKVLKERNMTQTEFASRVGISTSTISEWKKKKTNPSADKIMDICNVLKLTPEQLLTGKGIDDAQEIATTKLESSNDPYEIQLINNYRNMQEEQQKRVRVYIETLMKLEKLEVSISKKAE